MKCEACGLESSEDALFHKVPRSFRLKIRTVCPGCVDKEYTRVYRFLFYAAALIGAAGVVISLVDRKTPVGPLFLNLTLLQLFVFAGTVLHELGHVLTAYVVGLRVFGIELGLGRELGEFRWAGLRWRFRAIPFGGFAHAALRDTKGYRLKESAFILGGPLVNAALVIVAIFGFGIQFNVLGGFSEGLAPARMFFFANASLLIYSLWPHQMTTHYGKLPNDALLLWQTWRRPHSEIKEEPWYRYFMEADECRRERQHDKAQKWIEEGLERFPDNYSLKMLHAYNLVDLERYRDALREYVILLALYKTRDEFRFTILNNIAFACLLTEEANLLKTADNASKQAFETMPWSSYLKGTRGAVLAELGQLDEGIELLRAVLANHVEKRDQAIVACLIARAEARRGQSAQSEEFFYLARRFDPRCPLLKWSAN